jgi:hypothetical protein
MNVLKVNYTVNPGAGAFVVIPQAGDGPAGGIADFALCQICRATSNGIIQNNPAEFLHWQTEGADRIKYATLHNGWFVDDLYRNNAQNYLYYLDSFDMDMQNMLRDAINENNEGGTLYMPNAATGITEQQYTDDISPHVVSIAYGNNVNQYPFLLDSPQQNAGTVLDFQVHMLYRSIVDEQSIINISSGFTWQFDASNQNPIVKSLLNVPSANFIACTQQCVALYNADNNLQAINIWRVDTQHFPPWPV